MSQNRGCRTHKIGSKGKGVLVWGTSKYSVVYRDPLKPDAYRQQGIGRITSLPSLYCDGITFISLENQTFDGVVLEQADGFISMDFFEMDENGFLIVNQSEEYFTLNSDTGELINEICNEIPN